jgi:hypothetical protein
MLTGAWLLALVATGMPLFAMLGSGGTEDDPEDAGRNPPDEAPQEKISHEAALGAEDDTNTEGPPLPTDYEFIVDTGGDHVIEGFRPGTDTLTLTSGDWDFDLHDLGPDEEGAALRIDYREGTAVIRFRGLDVLPTADIHLKVAQPGEEWLRVALLDALWPDDGEGTPLLPTDPDADDALPDDPSLQGPLAPLEPEEQDIPPDPIKGVAILLPTAPDAPEDAGRYA